MKKTFLHGLSSGLTAAAASMVYNYAYCKALVIDFSRLVNPLTVTAACVFAAMLISLLHYFFNKIAGPGKQALFNALLILCSLFSLIIPFSVSLPFDMPSPELFIGLIAPMHLLPALFWLGMNPLFKGDRSIKISD